ncbi:hypothetical protein JOF56_001028 [Kibdelosporangium banguiense]|uniref:PH domain-containing protein n=1 Tax=Kibdelosporangium banguiense TaxID=1365924 RepID=A0ABS4T887_9PSEU|nr:hypothetical protein [Kibdelosporangium banguiense]MBP2320643.1 hypothetical protein [Kibdelosporangium banguiense]
MNSKIINGCTTFALIGASIAGLLLVGLLTEWSPVLSEQAHPATLAFAVAFSALALRMRTCGCFVSDHGVRNRWEFGTSTVRWADIDHFEVRPSRVAPLRGSPTVMAAWLVLKDGRARHTMLWFRERKLDGLDGPASNEEHMNILPPSRFSQAYEELRKLHARHTQVG